MAEKQARKSKAEIMDELIANIEARFDEYDDAIERLAERKGRKPSLDQAEPLLMALKAGVTSEVNKVKRRQPN